MMETTIEYAYPIPLLVAAFRSTNPMMVIVMVLVLVTILVLIIIMIRIIIFVGSRKASKEEQGRKSYNNES